MAHYAFLDENNLVTEVITGIDETELIEGLDPETWYGNFRGQLCKGLLTTATFARTTQGLDIPTIKLEMRLLLQSQKIKSDSMKKLVGG
jgi:hypothetical protein